MIIWLGSSLFKNLSMLPYNITHEIFNMDLKCPGRLSCCILLFSLSCTLCFSSAWLLESPWWSHTFSLQVCSAISSPRNVLFPLSSPNNFYVHQENSFITSSNFSIFLLSGWTVPHWCMPPCDPGGIPSKHFSHFTRTICLCVHSTLDGEFLENRSPILFTLCPQPLVQDRTNAH